ncbi:hypothetical protein G9A89_012052 [Geosiphon pyriformis]|nr:hypothetical protein G9A89_012052 [Geosiphon pyriformis]
MASNSLNPAIPLREILEFWNPVIPHENSGKSYQYLGIFLFIDGLSRSSLAKAYLDIHFFCNLALRKAVSDKQFLYLVLAVLYPIISYRMQFSFVPVGVYNKWDALVHKDLKLKFGLPLDFPGDTIYYPFFYGLKSFSQFLSWRLIHLLSSPAYVHISASNNFLSSVVCIFLDCHLSLSGSLASSFRLCDGVLMSTVLGESLFLKFLSFFWYYGIAFKRLDPCGPVLEWFKLSVAFFSSLPPSSSDLISVGPLNICKSSDFVSVSNCLSQVDSGSLSVYTNGSLKDLSTLNCWAGAAVFFEDINLGLGVGVCGLVSSTLAELQAIALALKCIPTSRSVCLFSDSQAALDACKSELGLICSDFCNWYWVEWRHIKNIIHSKNLKVSWHKMKGHLDILGNEYTNSLADAVSFSGWFLPLYMSEHFLVANSGIVSGNSRHFVQDVFHAVCHVHWEVGSGSGFLVGGLLLDVDWLRSSQVWHSDLHMATDFTSRRTADFHIYFMKALYCQLPVAVRKCLYNKCSSSVLCLYCEKIELSLLPDIEFRCVLLKRTFGSFSFLLMCVVIVVCLCSRFFGDPKVAGVKITDFLHSFCLAFRNDIWLVYTKHRVFMEKCELIPMDGSASASISGSALKLSAGVIKLLGMSEAFGVCFGFRKHCSFFSGIDSLVFVVITI